MQDTAVLLHLTGTMIVRMQFWEYTNCLCLFGGEMIILIKIKKKKHANSAVLVFRDKDRSDQTS